MIKVSKAVKIFSTDGAGATIIRAPSALGLVSVVSLDTANAGLGKPGKGFTISGGGNLGVFGGVDGLTVSGNRVLATAGAYGILVNPSNNSVVRGNVVIGTSTTFGIFVGGNANQVIGNVATGCYYGFYTRGTTTLTGNVANDNKVAGIEVSLSDGLYAPPTKVDKNEAVGNGSAGFFISSAANPPAGWTVSLGRGNVFGNGQDIASATPNCGIWVENDDSTNPMTVTADGFFWGAASGPGTNPADAVGGVCNDTNGGAITLNTTNNALKPNSIKAPPQR